MVWENADASIDRAETLIKQAAEAAAECIIFPEMSFTGVTLNTAKVAEDPKDSRTVQRMKNWQNLTILPLALDGQQARREKKSL